MFGQGRKNDAVPPASRPRKPGPPPLLARTGRFSLVVFAVTAAFGAVGARLYWLHVPAAPKLRAEAESARRFSKKLPADRGRIEDSRSVLLATSRETWDIIVNPSLFSAEQEKMLPELAGNLSRIIHEPKDKILATFEKKFRDPSVAEDAEKPDDDSQNDRDSASTEAPGEEKTKDKPRPIYWVKVAEGVKRETKEAVEALKVKAIYPEIRYEREYPKHRLAAQLVGYVNRIGTPAMGVEKALDFYLKGEAGWIDSRKNRNGLEMVDRRIREIAPRDGQTVELTLDSLIQQACEEELEKIGADFTPKGAIAIVTEAKTGKLLALANWPSFDLNEYNDPVKSPLDAQRNRAVTDVYEPGSVFKICSYSAGINEGLFTPDTMIDCGLDAVPYRGKILKLPGDSHHMGRVDMRHAVWESSNRGAAQIGMRVAEARGEMKLWQYMADFGFGSKTGLVTGTEVTGTLRKPDRWDGITVTRLPMGHSVDVTALQMHFGMSVLATRGDLYAPMLINRVKNRDGTVVKEFEPMLRKKGVVTRRTAETVVDMLRGVVTDGTAKAARIPGYDVAGKTGTTQKLVKLPGEKKAHYSSQHHVASFSGFFPASDPRVVITVIIDEPSGKGIAYGGTYSAPAFKSIAETCIKVLGIAPVNQAEFEAAREKDRKKKGLPPTPPPQPQYFPVFDPFSDQ